MEYNKKKMCGSFCHFPFFIWCYYRLFLRINISTVAFCFNVPFSEDAVLLFLCCNLLDFLWLFTPFQMSIGKKKKKKKRKEERKRSIVPTCDTWPPFKPQVVAGKKIGK